MLVVGSALLFGQDWSAAYEPVLNDAEQIDAIERQIERELLQSSAPSADQEASIRKLGTIDPELQAVWTALTEEADALYREGSLEAISAQQGVIDFAADFWVWNHLSIGNPSCTWGRCCLRLERLTRPQRYF